MIAASAAALIGIVIIAAIAAIYSMLAERPERGRHARGTAVPAPDPMLLHALHHEPVWTATVMLPAPGMLPMLPPGPDPADTGEIPFAVGTWGKTVDQIVEEIFGSACAEVTS